MKWFIQALLVLAWVFSLSACQPGTKLPAGQPGSIKIVATTTIVADVVAQISGDTVDLDVLLPAGTDPHSFQPTPQDMAKVADAQVIFINGVGLETFLEPLIKSSGTKALQVSVSAGIVPLEASAPDEHAQDKLAEQGQDAGEDVHSGDPHVWMDPNNVLIWVDNIEKTLVDLDAQHAELYRQNAAAYRQKLKDLHLWIVGQTAQISPENRELVTDHQVFTYFAARYGFEQIGAIVPGYSTLSEPSAKQLAELEDAIREYGVGAVFVGDSVNPVLAQRVASDTGVQLVTLYTGSLTEASGPAANYLDYMRANVNAIVAALK